MRFAIALICVVLLASSSFGQGSALPRPASGLRPSPGAAPSAASPGSTRPSSALPTRPSTTQFSPPAATGGYNETGAAESEAASAPASNFGGRATVNPQPQNDTASRFQTPAAGGSFRMSDEGDAEATSEPAPAQNYSLPSSNRTLTPTATAPRTSFGAGGTGTTTSSTTSSNLSTPRNSLPSRMSAAPRVASAAPATTAPAMPTEAASPVAESLLMQSLQPRTQHELPGQPVALSQVVERGGSSAQRIRSVQTYWKLVTRVSAFHAAVDDRSLFGQIQGRQMSQHDRSALAAAQLAAEAAVDRAQLDFVTTQHELAEAAQFSDVDLQALPSDVPLVSEYRTHFTTLYGSGSAPGGLRRLDRAMPYYLKTVRSRADAVIASHQAVQAAAEAVSNGQATVAELLEIHHQYARERSAFTLAVYEYNAMIAEYALNVAPNQSPGTIVGMLIKTKPATRSATIVREEQVVRVSGEQPIAADQAPILQHEAQDEAMLLPAQVQQYELPREGVRYQVEESAVPVQDYTEDSSR